MRSTLPRNTTWSPPGYAATFVHSRHAAVPFSTGAPPTPSEKSIVMNLSSRDFAKWLESAIWSSARMLITKLSLLENAGWLREVIDWLHSTSGGSSDTEVNEFAVTP